MLIENDPVKCQKCGTEWRPRLKTPKFCKKCKRKDFQMPYVPSKPGRKKKPVAPEMKAQEEALCAPNPTALPAETPTQPPNGPPTAASV